MNELVAILPGLLAAEGQATSGEPPAPPAPPGPPSPPELPPAPALPPIPTIDQLLVALAGQIETGLDEEQLELLAVLDGPQLGALLALDPILLQVLGELDEEQVERLRKADPDDIDDVMLDLYNEVLSPAERLDEPLLPTVPTTRPPVPSIDDVVSGITGGLGG